MASSKEYLDYVLEQLSGAEGLRYRPMMGEFLIYCRNKLVGGVYDDRLLVKPTKSDNARRANHATGKSCGTAANHGEAKSSNDLMLTHHDFSRSLSLRSMI